MLREVGTEIRERRRTQRENRKKTEREEGGYNSQDGDGRWYVQHCKRRDEAHIQPSIQTQTETNKS